MWLLSTVGNQAWSAPPQKVISLAPHITELIFTAGAGKKVIGTVDYSDYPKEALNIARVGSANGINIEKILQLQPDLVIAWKSGNRIRDIERLQQLGINVIFSNPIALSDIPLEVKRFGKILQTQDTANQRARKLTHKLETTKLTYKDKTPIKAYYQIWDNPMLTINQDQFISQAIALCGAVNIFADLPVITPQVSIESVISRNPKVIILGGQQNQQPQWRQNWQKWPVIDAVKNGHILSSHADAMQRPTARLINSIAPLCKKINNIRKQDF